MIAVLGVLATSAVAWSTVVVHPRYDAVSPTAGGNAGDTVSELSDQGYNVQINGPVPVPLSRCKTTGIHGIPNAVDALPPSSTTVYVDVSCPDDI
ncbi:hypothetical protein ACQ856_09300 [Mycolicibacterium psychrotolerans]|uniref:hypothetical protein n=1 Tax=Mycolicibacterium psychrotolerans TaxID=216929 RepID=UPI003D669EEB